MIWINIENVMPNTFNPNVMGDDEQAALLLDMQNKGEAFWNDDTAIRVSNEFAFNGVETDDPIVNYFIVDGEHRWIVAGQAGHKRIGARDLEVDEAEARERCYKINKLRGTIDPYKEIVFWGKEAEAGLTHQEIADKYGWERSQISKSLSILKLHPIAQAFWHNPNFGYIEAIEYIKDDNPRYSSEDTIRGLTRSHLEELVGIPDEQQIIFGWNAIEYGNSVERVASWVKNWKVDQDKALKLEEMKEIFKMDSCPLCDTEGIPNHSFTKLRCPEYCNDPVGGYVEWDKDMTKDAWLQAPVVSAESLNELESEAVVTEGFIETTPETVTRAEKIIETETTTAQAEEKKEQNWFKTALTEYEIHQGISKLIGLLVKNFEDIEKIEIKGKIDGVKTWLEYDPNRTNKFLRYVKYTHGEAPGDPYSLGRSDFGDPIGKTLRSWPEDKLYFTFHDGGWKTGDMKSRVDVYDYDEKPNEPDAVKETLKQVAMFLEFVAEDELENVDTSVIPSQRRGASEEELEAFYEWYNNREEVKTNDK